MQPPGGKIPAAGRSHDPPMNGTAFTNEANGMARPAVGASSFRALQERLRARPSRPIVVKSSRSVPMVIPDLVIEPEPVEQPAKEVQAPPSSLEANAEP